MKEVCTCGHALDEHGGDSGYPGSSKCNGTVLEQSGLRGDIEVDCDCTCFEQMPYEGDDL